MRSNTPGGPLRVFSNGRCRRCDSTDLHQSRFRNDFERALSWLTCTRPYRCLSCSDRMWRIGTGPLGTSPKKLSAPRRHLSNTVPDGADSAVLGMLICICRVFNTTTRLITTGVHWPWTQAARQSTASGENGQDLRHGGPKHFRSHRKSCQRAPVLRSPVIGNCVESNHCGASFRHFPSV